MTDIILNLTQHNATEEQMAAGVVELPADLKERLIEALTFSSMDEASSKRWKKAMDVVQVAQEFFEEKTEEGFRGTVMIGGAPFFMAPLQESLEDHNFKAVYAFSERVSEEKKVNGEVVKTSRFKHLGFV